ncbi:hypothetical protein [Paractinoplanes atraurantiacus]|uniref:Uncharacterized protein n=1 Tax=Paractinoplanes atraurantiacus TaxID=1036182 RepID=A0A285GXH6_9ACTN|nr:hypothetical protein [Actinoplanes atraurantiacus]SNY28212.1 hypothetical protein SAMN05421748_10344 [Actinoplanes atraurantiacus]
MLNSLLPGLREIRTPLATGYLWLLNLWVLFGDRMPRQRPAAGPLAGLWDLAGYAGKGAVLAALTFTAYLVGSLVELNPQRLWAHGGRPELLSRLRDLFRRGVLKRVRAVPFSAQAERDLVTYSTEDLGKVIDSRWAATKLIQSVMHEERQLATRLQAQNAELFGRYDRLLAESAFRLNIAPPLVLLLALLSWRSALPAGIQALLIILSLSYGAILVSQAVMRAVQSRDVIAQALVVGILESKSLPRPVRSPDGAVGEPKPTVG